MSISTVNLSGNVYTVYATEIEANAHLLVDSARNDVWAPATSDVKSARLVEATRFLDGLPWRGEPVVPGQPNRFPRDGLTDADGNPHPNTDVPPEVELACAQLAADFLAAEGAGLSPSSNIKSVEAGPVEVQFFEAVGAKVLPDEFAPTLEHLLQGGSLGPHVPSGAESWTSNWPLKVN